MKRPQTISVVAWEGSRPFCMSRVVGADGAYVTQASISQILVKVVPAGDTSNPTLNVTLDKTEVIFDALQTDARWTVDSTGYNFRHQLPADALPQGNTKYLVQYKLLDSGENPSFLDEFEIETKTQHF